MGSDSGLNDYTFKRHFQVTGVDTNPVILEIARKTNSEVPYIEEDMRTVDMGMEFNTAVIPESINYMTTREYIRKVIMTAKNI